MNFLTKNKMYKYYLLADRSKFRILLEIALESYYFLREEIMIEELTRAFSIRLVFKFEWFYWKLVSFFI
jgi:hypothetical protein